jgi:hypothetical protein
MSELAKVAFKSYDIYNRCGRYAGFAFANKHGVRNLLIKIIQLEAVKDFK